MSTTGAWSTRLRVGPDRGCARGVCELGWVGTRLDGQGRARFDPLNVPFLVDSYAASRGVERREPGAAVRRRHRRRHGAGRAGAGAAASAAARRPVARADGSTGAKDRVVRVRGRRACVAALGAVGVPLGRGASITGLDGVARARAISRRTTSRRRAICCRTPRWGRHRGDLRQPPDLVALSRTSARSCVRAAELAFAPTLSAAKADDRNAGGAVRRRRAGGQPRRAGREVLRERSGRSLTSSVVPADARAGVRPSSGRGYRTRRPAVGMRGGGPPDGRADRHVRVAVRRGEPGAGRVDFEGFARRPFQARASQWARRADRGLPRRPQRAGVRRELQVYRDRITFGGRSRSARYGALAARRRPRFRSSPTTTRTVTSSGSRTPGSGCDR